MFEEPKLSEAEWGLILEMLERERNELPTEIHHTRSSSVREELHQRMDMVRELIVRIRQTQPTMTMV